MTCGPRPRAGVKGVKTQPWVLTCGLVAERVLGQPALSYSLIRPPRTWRR